MKTKDSASHYAQAEALLAEGVQVINAIAAVGAPLDWIEIEQRRDALGKKVMGIWAQAQVHATLALVDVYR